MKFRVLHHDHCFDGFASAAVFARFLKEKLMPDAEISFKGLSHQPNQKLIEEENFDGDQNAIVDFKYSPTDKLTWWFDHHQSAFLSAQDERHYFDHQWPTKFYNPDYKKSHQVGPFSHKTGFLRKNLSSMRNWIRLIPDIFPQARAWSLLWVIQRSTVSDCCNPSQFVQGGGFPKGPPP